MAMIIAGIIMIVVALVDKGNSFARYGNEQSTIMEALLVGGFIWIAVGYLLRNLTVALEKKAKLLDQNRE